jgi:hypothetical protein
LPVRLAVTLGPPCPFAETRVRLGGARTGGDPDADYSLDGGEPVALARALVRAVTGDAS